MLDVVYKMNIEICSSHLQLKILIRVISEKEEKVVGTRDHIIIVCTCFNNPLYCPSGY